MWIAGFVTTTIFHLRSILAGEEVCFFFERNAQHFYMGEICDRQSYETLLYDVENLIPSGEPCAIYRRFMDRNHRRASYRFLMLPLASDGTTVDAMISVVKWQLKSRR